ncbi:hypothetical protein scyTo_0013197 [Scyliorhinus torazame]|uniref:Uncharacterized protein n=1 Tax=Scyliorhinus torazame TaxID=75743 RepID=A0A401NR52_SCYTO|nr:hypothetical protein [Scyliorhinus torazame]
MLSINWVNGCGRAMSWQGRCEGPSGLCGEAGVDMGWGRVGDFLIHPRNDWSYLHPQSPPMKICKIGGDPIYLCWISTPFSFSFFCACVMKSRLQDI